MLHMFYSYKYLILHFKQASTFPLESSDGSPEKYYSVDHYNVEEEDEVPLRQGEVVEVLQKSMDGWWKVKVMSKQVGLAPATFLKKLENVEIQSSPVRTIAV